MILFSIICTVNYQALKLGEKLEHWSLKRYLDPNICLYLINTFSAILYDIVIKTMINYRNSRLMFVGFAVTRIICLYRITRYFEFFKLLFTCVRKNA